MHGGRGSHGARGSGVGVTVKITHRLGIEPDMSKQQAPAGCWGLLSRKYAAGIIINYLYSVYTVQSAIRQPAPNDCGDATGAASGKHTGVDNLDLVQAAQGSRV